MEAAFVAVADRLQAGGMTPEQAADEMIAASADAGHAFAADLRGIVVQAVSAGWREIDAARGIVSLAENHRMAVDANRQTEREIRRAWGEPS